MRKILKFILLFCFSFMLPVMTAKGGELIKAIERALEQSDYAYDLQDNLVFSQMDVASVEHRFDTKIVPLTTVGFTQGTGSQQIGLEFRKAIETGGVITYGAVGDRLDEDSDYVVQNARTARAYVRLSQGLFRRWGRDYNLAELNVAQLRLRKEEINTERGRQTLILDTVRKYYDLVLAGQLMEKSEQALDRSQKHLLSAQSRQAVGLVSKVDVYRAELAVLDVERSVQNQLRQKNRALDSFRELLHFPESDNIVVTKKIIKMIPVVSDSWEQELFKTRLDWQAHQVNIEVNKIEFSRAKRDLSPDIGLSFTLEQKGEGETVDEALELDQTNWSVQLEMLSSFDNFNEESILLRKKMEMAKLRRTGEAIRRKIKREADEAFLDLLAEENNYQISLRGLHQAEMGQELATTRYEKGISDNLDILDAESSFSEAELEISRSLTAYNIAAVNLAYSLGVLDLLWIEMSQVSYEE
jgi:outer membrane protein